MSKLLERTDLFQMIARLTTNVILEYHPEEDVCIVYKIEDDGLKETQEISGWKEVLYNCTHTKSYQVLDELFRMIAVRAEEGEYEFQVVKGLEGDLSSWIHCTQKYLAEEDYYIAFISRIDERMKENLLSIKKK